MIVIVSASERAALWRRSNRRALIGTDEQLTQGIQGKPRIVQCSSRFGAFAVTSVLMFKDMERDVREFAFAVLCMEAHLLVAGPLTSRD